MSMKDDIELEVFSGYVPTSFTPKDLMRNPDDNNAENYRIGNGIYKQSTILTSLNNLSVGPGDRKGNHVKRGSSPQYRKYENGAFGLVKYDNSKVIESMEESSNDKNEVTEKKKVTKDKKIKKIDQNTIYTDFVNYLEEKPFRIKIGNGKWYPSQGQVTGWLGRLNCYAWPLRSTKITEKVMWSSTSTILSDFTSRIEEIIDEYNKDNEVDLLSDKAKIIYDEIRKWGNSRGTERPGKEILKLIIDLANGSGVDQLPVNSTLTKLYAFTKPNEYVIYDSRVAYAIISIAEDLYRRVKINDFQEHFPHIGHMKGAAQSGTRPRGLRSQWPDAYEKWAAQKDANTLCIGIRNNLNRRGVGEKENWTLREVEAILFMEGY